MANQEEPPGGPPRRASRMREGFAAHDLSVGRRLLVVALNYTSLLHVSVTVLVGVYPWAGSSWRVAAAIGVLYLLPAVLARIVLLTFPIRNEIIAVGSADFFKWWALTNLQLLFSRLPLLEEALRVVPALYSAWLRLWGSKIGRLVFWAPGTRILDRSFLVIGDDVLLGASVQLAPHLLVRREDGRNEVILATVKVGDRAVVGGYSVLGPGSEVAADEATRARLLLHPFALWRDGKRVKR